MNCRPGDLAIIVGSGNESDHWALGKLVRCLGSFIEFGYVCWNIEQAVRSPNGLVFTSVYDGALRPIRNPGDDAVDESIAWLPPVPLPTIKPSLVPEKDAA